MRQFTSADGNKKMMAKTISHLDGKFVIELAGGNRIPVKAAAFSQADQDYLREFAKNNISYNFRLASKSHGGDKTKATNTAVRYWESVTQQRGYNIILDNYTPVALEELEVRSMIYRLVMKKTTASKSHAEVEWNTSSKKIDKIAARTGRFEFSTGTVPIISWKFIPPYSEYTTYSAGGDNKFNDYLGGYWIRIYHQGKLVHEEKEIPKAAEKLGWSDKSSKTGRARP